MSLKHFPSCIDLSVGDANDCPCCIEKQKWKRKHGELLREFFEWLDKHPCFILIGQPERKEYEEKKKALK